MIMDVVRIIFSIIFFIVSVYAGAKSIKAFRSRRKNGWTDFLYYSAFGAVELCCLILNIAALVFSEAAALFGSILILIVIIGILMMATINVINHIKQNKQRKMEMTEMLDRPSQIEWENFKSADPDVLSKSKDV